MKLRYFTIIILAATLAGCAIPFDAQTEQRTVEVQNTLGFYVETEVSIPSEARKDGVSFSDVKLDYTVRRDGNFEADVAIYADSEEEADGEKGDAEKLVDVHLDPDEESESGVATSARIKEALNQELRSFVVGAENLSTSLDSVYVDVRLSVEGEYDRF